MFEDYYGTPDLGLLQSLLAGEQGLPTAQPVEAVPVDAGQRLPTAQPVQAVPADITPAIDPTLAAYFKKIGIDPATAAMLSPDDMKRMAYSAREDAYNTALQADLQRTGKLQSIGTTYAEANPQDYYNTFGTVPLQSLGKSRFGIDEKTWGQDTKNGAEGIKYLTPDANATYTLYSPRSGQTLGTGVGAEGLLSLTQMAQNQTATKDRKADWQLIKTPSEGGAPEIIASNLYNTNLSTLGKIVAGALPIATAFIPGLNVLGSIAAGAGAGGLSAAMKEQNILKGALLGGATAGLVNAPILPGGSSIAQSLRGSLQGAGAGTMPSIEAALADVGSQLAGTSVFGLPAAAGAATAAAGAGALAPAFGDIVVKGSLGGGLNVATLAPTLAGGTLGAALAAAQPGPVNYGDQVYDQPTQDIVVEGAKPIPPVTPVPSLTIDQIMTLPAATTLAPNTSTITEPSTTQPEAKTGSLLNDIMKYYSLGSGVLDALGVGQGGGGSTAATTPYTSTLGVLPSFGRGAFTPYQGDYEQYGFGPEFNFFGGAKNG